MYFVIIGLSILLSFHVRGEFFDDMKQKIHVENILSSNEIYPMRPDTYYGSLMDTMFNYDLCPILNNYVRKTHKWSANDPIYKVPAHQISHDFSKQELKTINYEYMKNIYNKKNCPYTFRPKNVFININNETANRLYYNYCKDYFRGEPSDTMPYLFGTGMIITITLYTLGILN